MNEKLNKIKNLEVFDDKFKVVKRDAEKIYNVYGLSEEEFDKILDEVMEVVNECEVSNKDLAKLDKVPKALIVATVIGSDKLARMLAENVIEIIEEVDDFEYVVDLIEVIDSVKQPYQAAYLALLQGADRIANYASTQKILKALLS